MTDSRKKFERRRDELAEEYEQGQGHCDIEYAFRHGFDAAATELLPQIEKYSRLEEKLRVAIEALEQITNAVADNTPGVPERFLKTMIVVAEAKARIVLAKLKDTKDEVGKCGD